MPKSGLNVALKGLDDLFSSEETRQEEQREQVQQIPVDELFPFKNHPFKVLDDDAMTRTVEVFHNSVCWLRSSPAPDQRAAMKSSPGIVGNTPPNLLIWTPCLSLCATWRMMPPRY